MTAPRFKFRSNPLATNTMHPDTTSFFRNSGDATAAEVAVRGVLSVAGEAETSDTVLDFLPPRSNRKSVLIFRRDPAMGSLALSVRGYNAP